MSDDKNDAKPLHPAWLGVWVLMMLPGCVLILVICWFLATFFGLL